MTTPPAEAVGVEKQRGLGATAVAPAKINLYLKVLGRRSDGYHELDTVMAKLDLADRLWVDVSSGHREDRLELTNSPGDLPDDFSGSGNLILKAVAAFRRQTRWPDKPVAVRLEKNIPLGAGMGGGSSDCAAILSLLNKSAPQPLSRSELEGLGLSLGADVPFFLQPAPLARAGGVGEKFSEPPSGYESWLGRGLTLVNPGIKLPTALVFKNWDLTNPSANTNLGPISPPQSGENDLLAAVGQLVPAITEIIGLIEGLKPSAWGLSGSGPTFWFSRSGRMAEELSGRYPQWWFREAKILTQ